MANHRSDTSQHHPATPDRFRATVHGSVFGARTEHLERIEAGDSLLLIPDPPVEETPAVWVHRTSGDPVGHLPPEIASWLVPWMQRGGRATARALRVKGPDEPSWRRLLIEVVCVEGGPVAELDPTRG
ncbi:MAG TPA: hypothetical protein VK837_13140 [Longimicrobiales bacterium]|nr:hypothetical protein [Longimicrobiales bacterium]